MTPVLASVVYIFVGLPLALLLRGSTRTVASTVLTALSIMALIRAGAVTLIFVALVAFLRGRRVGALMYGHVALLLLASVVVVSACHSSFLRQRSSATPPIPGGMMMAYRTDVRGPEFRSQSPR
jgi:hypothetical protein